MISSTQRRPAARRSFFAAVASLGYGFGCYVFFVAAVGYSVAFLMDGPVPRTIDRGGPATSYAAALAIDSGLMALFAVQHSVMARPAFKRWWTRLVPPHLERSTYVLLSSVVLALMCWQWRPIPAVLWDVQAPPIRGAIWCVFFAGWAWAVAMTFAIDQADFFGLRQVLRRFSGAVGNPAVLAVPWPYRLVRHPMMLGFFIAFLVTPTMTAGHALFALLGCGYIIAAVRLEERDLRRDLTDYDAYAIRTPRFLPRRGLCPHSAIIAEPTTDPSTPARSAS